MTAPATWPEKKRKKETLPTGKSIPDPRNSSGSGSWVAQPSTPRQVNIMSAATAARGRCSARMAHRMYPACIATNTCAHACRCERWLCHYVSVSVRAELVTSRSARILAAEIYGRRGPWSWRAARCRILSRNRCANARRHDYIACSYRKKEDEIWGVLVGGVMKQSHRFVPLSLSLSARDQLELDRSHVKLQLPVTQICHPQVWLENYP
jgi:hypothetical protein